MTFFQRILLSITIFACLIAISGISAAQKASPPAQTSDLEQQIKIIIKILDELDRSDLNRDEKNKIIETALDSLIKRGESHEIFKRTIQSAIPLGQEIVNNLMISENNIEKENQRLVATQKIAALILMLTLAHLEDLDRSFTKIDSSLEKVQANSDTIKKLEEHLNSLKQIRIFNTNLTIHQQTFYFSVALTFSFTLVAIFPISGDPLWLWCIKKVVEYILKR